MQDERDRYRGSAGTPRRCAIRPRGGGSPSKAHATAAPLRAALADLASACPFDTYLVRATPMPGDIDDGIVAHSWPSDFHELFVARRWDRRNPWKIVAATATAPFTEVEALRAVRRSPDLAPSFHIELDAIGRHTLSTPVFANGRRAGTIGLSRRDGPFDSSDAAVLAELAPIVHRAALHRVGGRPRELTIRERECLAWTSMGKTSWEIGGILGIGEETVNTHLKAATRKLGAVSRVHAVAEALRRGLIA